MTRRPLDDAAFIEAMQQGIPPLPQPLGPARGLDVLELGNADLVGTGTYEGQPATADGHAAPLPEYPQKSQLPPTPPKYESFAERMRRTAPDACMFLGGLLMGVAL